MVGIDRPQGGGIFTVAQLTGAQRRVLGRATNTWPYSWAQAAAQLAAFGNARYKMSHIYVEYRNLTDASSLVSAPAIDRAEELDYYAALAGTSDTDYLRLPVLTAEADRDPDYAGTAYLAAGKVNRVVLRALTAGSVGVNARPFGYGHNSKVYGLAVVAAPVPSDPTQDVIWARAYYDPSQQFLAPPVGAMEVTYASTFY